MKKYILVKADGGGHKCVGGYNQKEAAINYARELTTYTGEEVHVYKRIGHFVQAEAVWKEDK